MKVSDIVSFSKESFFNGAVQTEWFYDDSKVGAMFSTVLSIMECRVTTLSLAHISFWILPPSPKILQTSFTQRGPTIVL